MATITIPRGRAVLAVAVACVASIASCGGTNHSAGTIRVLVPDAAYPVALTPGSGGSLLYAERLTGRVRRVERDGTLDPIAVAKVDVTTMGQRGLLGLAIDSSGRIFAAFTNTDPGSRLEVAQLTPTPRRVWTGPPSARLANGGHLVFDQRRNRLILGIGDLGDRSKTADPNAPNGKLLLLDPDAPRDQRPTILSQGWNNPFAFTLTRDGAVWVADNVPGQRGERLARGDRSGRPTRVTLLPTNTAPAALASAPQGALIVCSYTHRRTLAYRVRKGHPVRTSAFGDGAPCRTGAATRSDGKALWLADEHTISTLSVTS